MEDKREFNDILIDDRAQYQDRSKKIMLLVVAAAVLLIILLVSAIAMSGTEDKPQVQQIAQENGLQPQAQPNTTNSGADNVEFEPVQTTNTADNDRFAEIIKRIQDQNAQSTETKETNTESTRTPILETASQSTTTTQNIPSTPVVAQPQQPTISSIPATKPTQPAKPIQASKPQSTSAPVVSAPATQPRSQPKSTQASQSVTKPTQPTQPTQVVQSTQPTSAPNPQTESQPRTQPTQSVDKSKNGQVAQKGHYIQVGSFENTPNKDFLNKINNYSYRVYGAQSGTKYLIGPYDSRTDANRDMLKVKTDMGDQVFYYEVK